ncbi:hypothetical protein CkaCkLH20_05796 [Colletotrichum karsti]|uniref:Uncharacterized protein n=1 Tax=Colletotrichum karsti TaxID=1095194 RepID=A0A9P6I6U3_9PEZI|nr:uncharacterized protein CkaCkLH20_05796 [Colletotrichum karsti]KAF9876950.1 hypothetical protein CkaCkLH20_05796 [Colletotrichum karsti]
MVALYAALYIFTWTTTCILAYRPLWTSQYTTQYLKEYQETTNRSSSTFFDVPKTIAKNKSWYQAIRVLQSIVAVSTLPLTTAVMSAAAVIYVQRTKKDLSLRQLIVLADKSWSDIVFLSKWTYMDFSTPFLKFAVFLYVLGGLLSPLQQYFLSIKTIKASYYQEVEGYVTDIPDQFNWRDRMLNDDNLVVLITRGMLETTSLSQPQAQLWRGPGESCSDAEDWVIRESEQPCRAGTTMDEMMTLPDPFLAQLPSGYSTGLINQFIPRINSSAEVTPIDANDFPKSCRTTSGSFWAEYLVPDGSDDKYQFGLQLPNYWNETAGELLEKDPFGPGGACQRGCAKDIRHNPYDEEDDRYYFPPDKAQRIRLGLDPWDPNALEGVINKGPLLTIALALFGRNSFLERRLSDPSAYTDLGMNETANPYGCAYLSPLNLLFLNPAIGRGTSSETSQRYCISNAQNGQDDENVYVQVANWATSLFGKYTNTERLGTLFRVAAFLANQAWLDHQTNALRHNLHVYRDLGIDTLIPSISLAGIITISMLLMVYLVALAWLAAYAARRSSVVDTKLDAWAMMKIGASQADRLGASKDQRADDVKDLDHIPGRIVSGVRSGDG